MIKVIGPTSIKMKSNLFNHATWPALPPNPTHLFESSSTSVRMKITQQIIVQWFDLLPCDNGLSSMAILGGDGKSPWPWQSPSDALHALQVICTSLPSRVYEWVQKSLSRKTMGSPLVVMDDSGNSQVWRGPLMLLYLVDRPSVISVEQWVQRLWRQCKLPPSPLPPAAVGDGSSAQWLRWGALDDPVAIDGLRRGLYWVVGATTGDDNDVILDIGLACKVIGEVLWSSRMVSESR